MSHTHARTRAGARTHTHKHIAFGACVAVVDAIYAVTMVFVLCRHVNLSVTLLITKILMCIIVVVTATLYRVLASGVSLLSHTNCRLVCNGLNCKHTNLQS
jgi:hypothetical protein